MTIKQYPGITPNFEATSPPKESVWNYPRPPVAQRTTARILIEHRGCIVADTRNAVRTLETSHPPSYYIPRGDIAPDLLLRAAGSSFCEWKGTATYWGVFVDNALLNRVGWSYANPPAAFEILRDHIAFYASPFDRCSVDGETVVPQPGEFYGGWITSQIVGPFKGVPGSQGW